MINYVRIRTVRPGKFAAAIAFLKDYIPFVSGELGTTVRVGTAVGKLGTVVLMSTFENAQAWEDAMNKIRSNDNYTAMIDEAAEYFEDETVEHLITELPT